MAKHAPRGKQEIVDALLDAAEYLIAKHGPNAFTMRDVGERAGLRHSLIFRYIGNKRDLIRAVHRSVLQRINNKLGTGASPIEIFEMIASDPTAGRFFIRTAAEPISGDFNTDLLEFDRVVHQTARAQARGQIVQGIHPEIVYALGLCLGMGWFLLEQPLTRALKLPRTETAKLRAQVSDDVIGLFQGRFGIENEMESE